MSRNGASLQLYSDKGTIAPCFICLSIPGAQIGPAVPSIENLQTFVDTWVCQANKKNVPYYYFEAFDEPWKNSINPRESQWGLMTVDRKLKVTIPNC